MRFPAFENPTLKRPEWALSSDEAIASWLKLAVHASIAENGGKFVGGASWDDRAWTIMANVTKSGVEAAVAAGICRWDGTTLEVLGYETSAERKVQQQRENGRLSPGRPRKTSTDNQTDNRPVNPTDIRAANRSGNQTGNRSKKALSYPLPSLPLPSFPEADSSELGSADSKPVATFPIAGKMWDAEGEERVDEWSVDAEHHSRLVTAFPGVDVAAEYPKILAWLLANPTRKKTPRGMPNFLYGWMARQQNDGRAPSGPNGKHLRALPPLTTKLDTRV